MLRPCLKQDQMVTSKTSGGDGEDGSVGKSTEDLSINAMSLSPVGFGGEAGPAGFSLLPT